MQGVSNVQFDNISGFFYLALKSQLGIFFNPLLK